MPVMARCPNAVGSEKNLRDFFDKKTFGVFYRPPRPLLRSPLPGGALPGPPGTPPWGGPPQKRGRPSPREKSRKKGEIWGPICEKWGFWGQKWPFSGEICTFLSNFQK